MAAKPLTSEAIALTEKKMDMALDDIIKMSKNNTSKSKKQHRPPNKGRTFTKNAAQEKSAKMRRFMDSRSTLRQGVLAQRRSNFKGNQFPLASEAARKAVVAPLRNRPFSHNVVANWKSRSSTLKWVGSSSSFGPVTVAGAGILTRKLFSGFDLWKVGAPSGQRRAGGNAGSVTKQPQHQQGNTMPKQRPQTLDSLFANMKEQRMRFLSHKNNAAVQRNRSGQQMPPWGRGRFGN